MASDITFNPQSGVGLNTESGNSQLGPGQLTFALNALISSFDGNEILLQNEEGSLLCSELPEDAKVIGVYNIVHLGRTVYFLVLPDSSEIGYVENGKCNYNTLINSTCLNFNINHPIHQVVHKSTNCGESIYWTDAYNNMRHLSFDDLPWKEVPDPSNPAKKIKVEGSVDCNKLLVQPNFSIPQIEVESVVDGGNLTTGTYQFVPQYANEIGESYTQFYNPSNPISINDPDRATVDYNLTTNYSINVKVKGLDDSGLFDYFNLVVIETINGITTNRLVGTYPITNEEYTITYSKNSTEEIQISSLELFQKFQRYEIADGVTTSDDRIIWYNLKNKKEVNYQPIWSKVKIQWGTAQLPYTRSEAYYNPINTHLYKGHMRDEVYPLEGVFLYCNGGESRAHHIPGRAALPFDLDSIPTSNLDSLSTSPDQCSPEPAVKPRWQVYNTGSLAGDELPSDADECYKGPYQYGDMAYWESLERYPNNELIWGELANQPIRHHKFPDEIITPRFKVIDGKEFIYPIGFRVDVASLYEAIKSSDLTQEEKDQIVGFKIYRGDRSSGNMSVKAKGHFFNVGKYEHNTQTFYFPNYPYNSVGDDPLFAVDKVEDHSGYRAGLALKPFKDNQGKDQLTFHSPDTHFGRVGNIDSGLVKLEAIDYGRGSGHFVKVKNNAEYKFTTQKVTATAAVLATGVAFDVSNKGNIEFNGSDFAQVFNNTQELIEKLIPYENMGYNINSIATLNQSFPIPNEGFKLRSVDGGQYLKDGFNSVESSQIINNFRRESSVYVSTRGEFKYAHEYDPSIPTDDSRFVYSVNPLSEDSTTDEEFWTIFKSKQANAFTALVYGLFSAADELSNGDNNLKLVLIPYLTKLLDNYLTGSFEQFKVLEFSEQECQDLAVPKPVQPGSAYSWDTKQAVYTVSSTGEVMTDLIISQDNTPTDGEINLPIHNDIPYLKTNENVTFNYMVEELILTPNQQAGLSPECDPSSELYEECLTVQGLGAYVQFARTEAQICGGRVLSALYNVFEYAKSVYPSLLSPSSEETLLKERNFNANAYYGALKANLPSQWGRIYSYTKVDTGFYREIDTTNLTPALIFGGDTFINKFSIKTKLPVYNTNLVGQADQKDVSLDEEGTLGNPMFYISTKPIDFEYNIRESDLAESFQGLGVKVRNVAAGSLLQQIGGAVMLVGAGLTATVVGSIAGVIVTAVGAVLYVIGALFSNRGSKVRKAMIRIYKDLLEQIVNSLGVKRVNLDNAKTSGVRETGLFYQYVYGVPTFFVESQVNVDYRQATNDNEGNFFPRVGTGIPDDWLQEDRVPIIFDNNYTYNKSFSKQNKESSVSNLPETYDPNKSCSYEFPNRAFYSEKSNLNETLNNWLIYKPVSLHDFPKTHGPITSMDGTLNRQVLVRFHNKSQIYGALTSIDTSTFQAYLGNDRLFTSTPPIDISDTTTGSMGSQHKMLIKTPHGQVYVDALRGQVVLLQGTKPVVISEVRMKSWFQRYLTTPSTTDNHFNGDGITGVYDELYDRILITKKSTISWTLSFSFKTQTWISWHSYLPNFYIPQVDYFQTSTNGGTVWNHNKSHTTFNNFYGAQYPYIVEYPYVFKNNDEAIQAFKDYTVALRYEDYDTPVEEDRIIYFNKAIFYNNNQCTGVLNLVPDDPNDLSSYLSYPKWNPTSRDIKLYKTDHYYNFNTIEDIVKNRNLALFTSNSDPVKQNLQLNESNLSYDNPSYNTPLLRAKDARVRLILDDKSNFKLISHINLLQTQQSYL